MSERQENVVLRCYVYHFLISIQLPDEIGVVGIINVETQDHHKEDWLLCQRSAQKIVHCVALAPIFVRNVHDYFW